MPEWKVHDKWAVKLGVSKKVSREINEFVDFPEKWFKKHYSMEDLEKYEIHIHSFDKSEPCLSLFKLSKLSKKFGHDMGRKAKWQADLQLECACLHYGTEGVKALVLHHILDYLEYICLFSKDKILKKIEDKFDSFKYGQSPISTSVAEVLEFVRLNLDEILEELKSKL